MKYLHNTAGGRERGETAAAAAAVDNVETSE